MAGTTLFDLPSCREFSGRVGVYWRLYQTLSGAIRAIPARAAMRTTRLHRRRPAPRARVGETRPARLDATAPRTSCSSLDLYIDTRNPLIVTPHPPAGICDGRTDPESST